MLPSDYETVKSIFIEGILTGNATFQTEAPTWEEWNREHTSFCKLVARLNEEVVGFGLTLVQYQAGGLFLRC